MDHINTAILDALQEIAPEIEPDAVNDNTDLREELDLDSMDFLNFVIALHESLNVDIPEADYDQLSTLGGCAAYLRMRLSDGAAN